MAKKLFIGGLSWDTTDNTLGDFFSGAGSVVSAKVITDRNTGRSRGFGFVEMSTDEEADAAKEKLNGQTLDGRAIVVNEARPMEPRTGGGGFQQGGDRRSGGRDRGGRNDRRGGY